MSKTLSIEDFWKQGYLQELNREFLHPLGLNLGITEEDGTIKLGPIRDARDIPSGYFYEPEELDITNAENIHREWSKRAAEREERLGYIVQPLP